MLHEGLPLVLGERIVRASLPTDLLEFEVAAPLEQVWKHMQDVPRIAPCLPGAELIDVNGDVQRGE